MKYIQVKNCKFANQERTLIDCEVLFQDLGWVPFTASINDSAIHSIEIFTKAMSGLYGEIAPYVTLEPTDIITISDDEKIRKKRNLLLQNLDLYVSNPLRWNSYSQAQKDDFARYRQKLLDVPLQPNFPQNVLWPQPPEGLEEPKEIPMSVMR